MASSPEAHDGRRKVWCRLTFLAMARAKKTEEHAAAGDVDHDDTDDGDDHDDGEDD